VILAEHIGKSLGAVFAGKNLVTHNGRLANPPTGARASTSFMTTLNGRSFAGWMLGPVQRETLQGCAAVPL
jgi:hypothetical protein